MGARKYAQSHIPGAHFLSVDDDLAAPRTGRNGRHPLPTPEALAATLSAIGVDATKQVVAYDQAQTTYSARLWWMLRWVGHRNVAVLDGGLNAWVRAGFAVTTVVPQRQPARFIPAVSDSPVSVETLVSHLADIDYTLIDARSADRFRGVNETIDPIGGHIPGSHNRPYARNLNADSTFKDADTLRNEWTADARRPHAAANRSFMRLGSHGLQQRSWRWKSPDCPGSRLYPGSWSEWSADAARPIER